MPGKPGMILVIVMAYGKQNSIYLMIVSMKDTISVTMMDIGRRKATMKAITLVDITKAMKKAIIGDILKLSLTMWTITQTDIWKDLMMAMTGDMRTQ